MTGNDGRKLVQRSAACAWLAGQVIRAFFLASLRFHMQGTWYMFKLFDRSDQVQQIRLMTKIDLDEQYILIQQIGLTIKMEQCR